MSGPERRRLAGLCVAFPLLMGFLLACDVESIVMDRGLAGIGAVVSDAGGAAGSPGSGTAGGVQNPGGSSPGGVAGFNVMNSQIEDKSLHWTASTRPETLSEMGGADECPGEIPLPNTACLAASGTECQYMIKLSEQLSGLTYVELRCVPDGTGEKRWYEVDGLTLSVDETCPLSPIVPNLTCAGLKACPSPGKTCGCYLNEWKCANSYMILQVDPPTEALEMSKPLSALTDRERATWCEWLADTVDSGGHTDLAVGRDGYLLFESPLWYDGGRWVSAGCLPRISAQQCVANLGFTECGAPLAELTDCVATLLSIIDMPSPTGCGEYLAREGCRETIVLGAELYGNRGCSIRVQ